MDARQALSSIENCGYAMQGLCGYESQGLWWCAMQGLWGYAMQGALNALESVPVSLALDKEEKET